MALAELLIIWNDAPGATIVFTLGRVSPVHPWKIGIIARLCLQMSLTHVALDYNYHLNLGHVHAGYELIAVDPERLDHGDPVRDPSADSLARWLDGWLVVLVVLVSLGVLSEQSLVLWMLRRR